MNRIAKFEKVSLKQFAEGMGLPEDIVKNIYETIKLPERATRQSAGYDFYLPIPISLRPRETIKIPTGIRARIDDGWVLSIYPRSSLGFKYRMQLNNTVGIIDADYYGSDNEGHIFAKITNDSNENKTIELDAGSAFMQGIFLPFGITVDDNCKVKRNGGIGSSDKKSKESKDGKTVK